MPSFIPRDREPYQKRELFEKRVRTLRGVIGSDASEARLSIAAERVRDAALSVIKARRSLLAGRPEGNARELEKLDRDEERWRAATVEAILAGAGEVGPPPRQEAPE